MAAVIENVYIDAAEVEPPGVIVNVANMGIALGFAILETLHHCLGQ
jgi:hypothetical protein